MKTVWLAYNWSETAPFDYMHGGKVITMIGKASPDDPRYAATWEPVTSDSSTDYSTAFSDSISTLSACS